MALALALALHQVLFLGPFAFFWQLLHHTIVEGSWISEYNLLFELEPIDLEPVLVNEKLLMRLNFLLSLLILRSDSRKDSSVLVKHSEILFE